MPTVYSYVVEHDDGFAPNPSNGLCSLARCKYGTPKRRNIVEMANSGDWIIGTGGANLRRSAGNGKLIYAMRVTEKMPLAEYFRRYAGKRLDAYEDCKTDGRFALVSRDFSYFGQDAIEIPDHLLEVQKVGRHYKSRFPEEFVAELIDWLRTLPRGKHGRPCMVYLPSIIRLDCDRTRRCNPEPTRKRTRTC